jgi:hypothetical protein
MNKCVYLDPQNNIRCARYCLKQDRNLYKFRKAEINREIWSLFIPSSVKPIYGLEKGFRRNSFVLEKYSELIFYDSVNLFKQLKTPPKYTRNQQSKSNKSANTAYSTGYKSA